jgi:DNA-binding MarR family transcriptional regulator
MGSLLQELLTGVPLSAVLQERVALAEEQYQRAIHENENYRLRVAAIEREIEDLRARMLAGRTSGLRDDTGRVLVHLFKAEAREDRDIESTAKKLTMEQNVLRYHLDQLEQAGLVDMESSKYLHGHVYWALTPKGRKHVVESRLISC